MIRGRSVLVLRAGLLALAAIAAFVPGASAQSAPRPVVSPPPPADFMLGRPKGFVSLDGGFLFASAGSDLYEFITDQLTIEKKNFNTPVIGGRIGVSLSPRLEVGVLYENATSQTASEYRDFIDSAGLPITQTTARQDHQIAATVRWSLLPSGRRISRFAWIPRTLTPFIGAGAGAIKYRFEQYGSFVDFQTRSHPKAGPRPYTRSPVPICACTASSISPVKPATRGVRPRSVPTSWISNRSIWRAPESAPA